MSQTKHETRAFEMSLTIDATPEDVWNALTDPRELVRWFPTHAAVTPGVGGKVRWTWENSEWDWKTNIDAWDPQRRLRLVYDQSAPAKDGKPAAVTSATLAIEFTIERAGDAGERAGGATRLRLVHSGYGKDEAWDDEFNSISSGWSSELKSLWLYLSRHKGQDRHAAWVNWPTRLSEEQVWARLTGPDGFALPADVRVGAPYALRAANGFTAAGETLAISRDAFAGTVTNLDDSLLRLAVHTPDDKRAAYAWLSTWGLGPDVTAQFAASTDALVRKLFPE